MGDCSSAAAGLAGCSFAEEGCSSVLGESTMAVGAVLVRAPRERRNLSTGACSSVAARAFRSSLREGCSFVEAAAQEGCSSG